MTDETGGRAGDQLGLFGAEPFTRARSATPTTAQIAARILAQARARSDTRMQAATAVPIDYDAMQKLVTAQRRALTRAVRSGDRDQVVIACRDAVREWNEPGACWPDGWAAWQCALHDALGWPNWVELEDLA